MARFVCVSCKCRYELEKEHKETVYGFCMGCMSMNYLEATTPGTLLCPEPYIHIVRLFGTKNMMPEPEFIPDIRKKK